MKIHNFTLANKLQYVFQVIDCDITLFIGLPLKYEELEMKME